MARLPEDDKFSLVIPTIGGPQRSTFVSESGALQIIVQSRKPEAQALRKWVCDIAVKYAKGDLLATAPAIQAGPMTESQLVQLANMLSERHLADKRDLSQVCDQIQIFTQTQLSRFAEIVANVLENGKFADRLVDKVTKRFTQRIEAKLFANSKANAMLARIIKELGNKLGLDLSGDLCDYESLCEPEPEPVSTPSPPLNLTPENAWKDALDHNVRRFFRERVVPAPGNDLKTTEVLAEFEKWCEARDLPSPFSGSERARASCLGHQLKMLPLKRRVLKGIRYLTDVRILQLADFSSPQVYLGKVAFNGDLKPSPIFGVPDAQG